MRLQRVGGALAKLEKVLEVLGREGVHLLLVVDDALEALLGQLPLVDLRRAHMTLETTEDSKADVATLLAAPHLLLH